MIKPHRVLLPRDKREYPEICGPKKSLFSHDKSVIFYRMSFNVWKLITF